MKEYHFIGIGGVGMSALAHILLQRGERVSGSDIKKSFVTDQLEKKGARIVYFHSADSIRAEQTIIYNSMISDQNPEIQAARKLSCKILHRSELLQMLLNGKKEIIVAGSHGKTTTSALLSYVLSYAKMDPSYVVGGFSTSLETNGALGKGEFFVAEGDESDGSFLKTSPFGAIVTNIDFDHLSYWKTNEALLAGFQEFINKVQDPSHFIYFGDDPYLMKMVKQGVSFGFSDKASARAFKIRYENGKALFDVSFQGNTYHNIEGTLLGHHNILNALGVFIMALTLGLEEKSIRGALSTFQGVKRRLENRGEVNEIGFIDDYAHHPNEIRAIVKTLAEIKENRRLVIVFQPHRFSRTVELFDEFVEVLQEIDGLILTDIYPAGESNTTGISTETLFAKMSKNKNATYVPKDQLVKLLKTTLKPKDLVVTLGAGDITEIGLDIQRCVK